MGNHDERERPDVDYELSSFNDIYDAHGSRGLLALRILNRKKRFLLDMYFYYQRWYFPSSTLLRRIFTLLFL